MKQVLWILSLMMVFGAGSRAFAKCFPQPSNVRFQVKSCEVLDPQTTPALVEYQSKDAPEKRLEFLATYYKGALVTGEKAEERYVYPTSKADACADFKVGKKVRKNVANVCCDPGPPGKCLYGGKFLFDLKGKPVDTK